MSIDDFGARARVDARRVCPFWGVGKRSSARARARARSYTFAPAPPQNTHTIQIVAARRRIKSLLSAELAFAAAVGSANAEEEDAELDHYEPRSIS